MFHTVLRLFSTLKGNLQQIDTQWWRMIFILAVVMAFVGAVYVFRKRVSGKKLFFIIALTVYAGIILASTVLSRNVLAEQYASLSSRINLSILDTWNTRLTGGYSGKSEILLNVLMFVPIGFSVSVLSGKKIIPVILIGFLLTLIIESMQLVTHRGFFELTDLIENVSGAVIGFVIHCILNFRIGRVRET